MTFLRTRYRKKSVLNGVIVNAGEPILFRCVLKSTFGVWTGCMPFRQPFMESAPLFWRCLQKDMLREQSGGYAVRRLSRILRPDKSVIEHPSRQCGHRLQVDAGD